MGIRNSLTVDQMSIFRAILRRGNLYDSPGLLGLNIFTSADEPSQAEILLRNNIKSGLRFIKSIFDFIDENGNVVSINYSPDFQKRFLKEIKESFESFQDLENKVQEFLNKESKKVA